MVGFGLIAFLSGAECLLSPDWCLTISLLFGFVSLEHCVFLSLRSRVSTSFSTFGIVLGGLSDLYSSKYCKIM